MSSLFGTLSIASGALAAEQGAMDATTNNVANANTPGYSRLRPDLIESNPVVVGSVTYGQGVTLQKLESLRDPILQMRIEEETQQQGQLNTFVSAMQQAQVQFTTQQQRHRISDLELLRQPEPALDRPHRPFCTSGGVDSRG